MSSLDTRKKVDVHFRSKHFHHRITYPCQKCVGPNQVHAATIIYVHLNTIFALYPTFDAQTTVNLRDRIYIKAIHTASGFYLNEVNNNASIGFFYVPSYFLL